METKILEIRDSMTFIGVLCVNMNPDNAIQKYYMRRVGYPCDGKPNIMITKVSAEDQANNDPYSWNDRTMATAHHWIIEHWEKFQDGDVIDVEFILAETPTQKKSERFTAPIFEDL